MVFARNAVMGFNRYPDRTIDTTNPHTTMREIPSVGAITEKSANICNSELPFICSDYG